MSCSQGGIPNDIINPFADTDSQIRMHPVLAARLKPHQVEGVRFLWQRVMDGRADGKNARGGLGSLLALEDGDKGAGCVLAHNMGLGKTYQVIAFLHTVACNIPVNNIELRRMLVLGPVNTLQNWKAELSRWIPEDGRLPGNRRMAVYILDEAGRSNQLRCNALQKWFKDGGVMCLGYEMYRNLLTAPSVRERKETAASAVEDAQGRGCAQGKTQRCGVTTQREKKIAADKKLLAEFMRYLRDPGPGILIADEGHLLRNHNSNVSKAAAAIRTKRRVVLTGSPLQNNLTEYHCMIDFITHGFLGTLNEFRNQFEIPIMNGEAKDAAPEDVKRMRYRNYVLTKKLEPMVQRRDFTPLVQSLPPKFEFTLKIRLSDIQKKLYKHAIAHRQECGMLSVLKAFHTLLKIWNHPSVLCIDAAKGRDRDKSKGRDGQERKGAEVSPVREVMEMEEDESDCQVLDECQGVDGEGSPAMGMGIGHRNAGGRPEDAFWYRRILERAGISEEELCNVECSGKMLVLWKLLHEADIQNEKVLVFTQSLTMLDVIEMVLVKNPVGSKRWKAGQDYYRLDGSKSSRQRQGDIDNFNDIANTRARLFLISTRAGSLGVNMVAANRVVLFDCNFNPSYDLQAIFRTYRYGQTRPCFVYRLVSWGTMEEKIYKRQINKQSRAARAVDSWQVFVQRYIQPKP
jgi:transcriptional regulator ATRX